MYYPLVTTSFWLQHAIWGLNPLPYHIVNVLMHAACALLLWRVLRDLNVPGAWFASALWALHPVMVESAAWITELKNTQSAFFYLLAILFFIKWHRARGRMEGMTAPREYAFALICAVLAILSKSSTVILPAVLGLCWWWLDRRWRWRNVTWLLPFLVVSLAASAWTIWEQMYHSHALGPDWDQNLAQRVVIAGNAIWFYLGKLVWPHPLIFIYPRWQIDPSNPIAYLPVLAAISGLFLLWWKRNTRQGYLFFAAAYFVMALLPVLGFFNVYFFRYSFVGDHFQYLASMGPIALAAAGIYQIYVLMRTQAALLFHLGFGILLLGVGTVTWKQAAIYQDSETLWRDTIRTNPTCWMAQDNLGIYYAEKGDLDAAISHYREAVRLFPNDPNSHHDLGTALAHQGKYSEAVEQFSTALHLKPEFYGAEENLGIVLNQMGHYAEAVTHLREALRLKEDDAEAQHNLALALHSTGNLAEAMQHYRKALTLRPDWALAINDLAWVLATAVDPEIRNGVEAVRLAVQACTMTDYQDASYLDTLAAAHAEAGDFAEAERVEQLAINQSRSGTQDQADLSAYQARLLLYRMGLPFRERVDSGR